MANEVIELKKNDEIYVEGNLVGEIFSDRTELGRARIYAILGRDQLVIQRNFGPHQAGLERGLAFADQDIPYVSAVLELWDNRKYRFADYVSDASLFLPHRGFHHYKSGHKNSKPKYLPGNEITTRNVPSKSKIRFGNQTLIQKSSSFVGKEKVGEDYISNRKLKAELGRFDITLERNGHSIILEGDYDNKLLKELFYLWKNRRSIYKEHNTTNWETKYQRSF